MSKAESYSGSYIEMLNYYLGNERQIFPPQVEKQDNQSPYFCVAYPDTYVNGLPNLGVSLIMQLLMREGATASRAFLPNITPDKSIGLLPIEPTKSHERLPVGEHDIVSFNISFETCFRILAFFL